MRAHLNSLAPPNESLQPTSGRGYCAGSGALSPPRLNSVFGGYPTSLHRSMKFIGSVLAFAFSMATASCSSRSAHDARLLVQANTIFRYVSIGSNVPVLLGSPLPSAAHPHLQEVAPNVFAVRHGHFSGAAEIAFRVVSGGRVAAVVFTYAAEDESFDAKVGSYSKTLGPPVRSDVPGERAARWQDARTQFEVAERVGGLVAVLADLALAAELRAAADVRPHLSKRDVSSAARG